MNARLNGKLACPRIKIMVFLDHLEERTSKRLKQNFSAWQKVG
jgi:hypothetical protein